jgi:Endonuclease/Exonuclease/phosphatase family
MIRIGTWNLWWRFGSWQARHSAILAVLRAANLDVCGLQEVWTDGPDNLARLLADALGMHWTFSPSPEPERWRARLPGSSAGAGNAILARWPIQDVADLALPPGGSGDRSRTALACVVDSPYGRVPLATTQLTAAPWDSVARCRQVRALVKFLADRQREDYPTISSAISTRSQTRTRFDSFAVTSLHPRRAGLCWSTHGATRPTRSRGPGIGPILTCLPLVNRARASITSWSGRLTPPAGDMCVRRGASARSRLPASGRRTTRA